MEEVIREEGEGRALVRGRAPIRDVNRELGLALPEGDNYSTIAGRCFDLASGMPVRGARLEANDGTMIEIVDSSAHAIREVRISRDAAAAGQ